MIAVWTATILAALVVICATGWLWTWLQWRECRRQFVEYSVSLKEKRP